MTSTLWPHQLRAVAMLDDAWAHHRRVLLVLPTGSGKTRTAAHVVAEHPGKVLFVVHRIELARQAASQLPGPVRIISGDLDDGPEDARVTVASVQTLMARGLRPECSLLVIDEAHNYAAPEWCQVLHHYREARVLGLTATPERGDGRPLGDLFDVLLAPTSIRDLTSQGVLVPAHVYAPPARQQGLAMAPHEALARYRWTKAVVFCSNVDHAREVSEQCRAQGYRTATVHGESGDRERAETLAQFRRGELDIVTNVFVLTEGWDDPQTDCLVLARGCTHGGTYLQMVGRVLRAAPGKQRAVVVDLTGASHEHGLPETDRQYSLEGKAIKASDRAMIRQCRACGAAYEVGPPTCPVCGASVPPPPRPKIARAELERIMATHTPDQKARKLRELEAIARARGYKQGWIAFRFKAQYGHWPKGGA